MRLGSRDNSVDEAELYTLTLSYLRYGHLANCAVPGGQVRVPRARENPPIRLRVGPGGTGCTLLSPKDEEAFHIFTQSVDHSDASTRRLRSGGD
jgi:hypothetical protein